MQPENTVLPLTQLLQMLPKVCEDLHLPPDSRPLTISPHLSAVLLIILRCTIGVTSSHNADSGTQLYCARCSGSVPASSGEISSYDDAVRENSWSETSTSHWKCVGVWFQQRRLAVFIIMSYCRFRN